MKKEKVEVFNIDDGPKVEFYTITIIDKIVLVLLGFLILLYLIVTLLVVKYGEISLFSFKELFDYRQSTIVIPILFLIFFFIEVDYVVNLNNKSLFYDEIVKYSILRKNNRVTGWLKAIAYLLIALLFLEFFYTLFLIKYYQIQFVISPLLIFNFSRDTLVYLLYFVTGLYLLKTDLTNFKKARLFFLLAILLSVIPEYLIFDTNEDISDYLIMMLPDVLLNLGLQFLMFQFLISSKKSLSTYIDIKYII
ncbi:MAG: hypothetical protein RB289_00295 [Paludibacter sp.]|jgi:hypothetical protein|nr:hypothetical protein [Paludibacter sp.]